MIEEERKNELSKSIGKEEASFFLGFLNRQERLIFFHFFYIPETQNR